MDERLFNELLLKKQELYNRVVEFRKDAQKVDHIYREIRNSLYVMGFLHHIPGHSFFNSLKENLLALERNVKHLKSGDNRSAHFFLDRMIELRGMFIRALDHEFSHHNRIFVITNINDFKKDLEKCDPLEVMNVLDSHLRVKELVISIDLSRDTRRFLDRVISCRSHVAFPSFTDAAFQFLVSDLAGSMKKKVLGTGFFGNIAFEIVYLRFVIFDCKDGFVLNRANHAVNNPVKHDKTVIVDSNCKDLRRSIHDKELMELLITDFRSNYFWLKVESLLMSKSEYNVRQRDMYYMPHLTAENSTRHVSGDLGLKISGKTVSDTFTSLGFVMRYFVVDHITPYVV